MNFLLHENSIQPVGLSPMTRLVTHWLLAVRDRHQTPFYRNPREGGWLGTTTTRLGFATTLSIFLFLCGWVYTGMSFVCFILFWNTLVLCSDIVYKTKEFQPTFQNSKLKFVNLDKIYFLLSGNLFSDWQQIFCSTSNIREIKQSGVELLYIKISCFKPMLYPTSNIKIVACRISYLSVTLWLSASIQLVAEEEMYHIILAIQLQ